MRSRVTGTRIHACLPPLWDLGSRHSPKSMHTGFWWQWSCGQKRQCGGTWGWAVVWPPLRLLGSLNDLLVWLGRCGPALWPWQQRREVIIGVGWGAVLPVHCPLSPCSGSRVAPRVRGALISGGHHQCGHSSCLPPSPPGEWPEGQTGETLGRVRRRPWPRTESQETPPRLGAAPRLEGVCDLKPPSAQRPCSPGWDTGRGGPPGGCPRAGKARVRDPETGLEPSAWAAVATPPPPKPGGSARQREWGWAPAGLRHLAVHFHAPRVPPLPPRSLSFSL